MIKGIEDFESKLQKAILEFIATNVDMSEDIEVLEVDEYVISINDVNFYVITDAEEKGILARYNKEKFDDFFDNLTAQQLGYVNEDLWGRRLWHCRFQRMVTRRNSMVCR